MPYSRIQEHRDEFDERNSFLYFVLGMISLSQSVMGSLGLPGQASAASPTPSTPPAPSAAPEESAVPPRISLLR